MPVIFGGQVFVIAPGGTIGFVTAFANGDYRGPIIAGTAPTSLGQRLVGSLGDVEFTARDANGLSSRCRYHHAVSNPNAFAVAFTFHFLTD